MGPEPSLIKFTQKTITEIGKLHSLLDKVQLQGFCFVDGEFEQGSQAIAVPIRDAFGEINAAAEIYTDISRVSRERLQKEFLPELRNAVSQISSLLYR